jgi:hypothetical protein
LKINKKHNGKEFYSYFRFVGQVKKYVSGIGENSKIHPIYEERNTKSGKLRRTVQFNLFTTKYNNIKVEIAGMEKEFAYIFSSTNKTGKFIEWKNRNDKSKYPDSTYHLIGEAWDLTKFISEQIKEDDWVDVKGKYQFDKFVNNNNNEVLVIKRIITSLEKIDNSQEIKINRNNKILYTCDFDSPKFNEINYFDMEIGIKSTYQDEKTKNTIVNGVFLDYGKIRSVPKDVKLTIYYKEPPEGKISLADAFVRLKELDFIRVNGIDNNRPIISLVPIEENEDSIFSNVDNKEVELHSVISGNKKGLEITKIISKTYVKECLTKEEISNNLTDDFNSNIDDNELPF